MKTDAYPFSYSSSRTFYVSVPKFISVLLLGFLFMQVNAQTAPSTPASTNGNNIDITYVRFNMIVDPGLAATSTNLLKGSVTTYFKTTEDNVKTIKFDFYRTNTATGGNILSGDSIHYHKVKYNLTSADHPLDTLIIRLPATIPTKGTLDSVTIFYHGNPPQNAGSRGYKRTTVGSTSPTGIISTHSSGFFARQWWPCKQNLSDKIDKVEFLITSPSAYKAVANGVLQNSNPPIVNGNKTWHWVTNYKTAPYLIAMAVHNYTIHNSPSAIVGGKTVPIVNYLTSNSNTTTIKGNCDAMKGVLEHFSVLFGDYPFKDEKYGHVAYTFGGGMENQTASYIGTGAFDRSILAHELAHQWWGDQVTCNSWGDVWVNEGFARYSEILYSEKFETAALAKTKRSNYKNGTNVKSTTGTVYRYDTQVNTDADHGAKIFNSSMVYDKASIVVSMLRKLVGDEKFFLALKNYLKDPAITYGHSATEDVRRHFEAVSGMNLTSFFDDFIYRYGYPIYNNVKWNYSPELKMVGIQLNQTKSAGSNVAHFNTVLLIKLKKTSLPAKDTTVIVYDDGEASLNTLNYKVSFPVDAIEIDPDAEAYAYDYASTKQSSMVIVLPVKLARFDAQKNGGGVLLTWESANEAGFSHYEIEQSADGRSFLKVGTVAGGKQPNEEYQFVHVNPNEGNNYYRLRMVDLDGSSRYSPIVTVTINNPIRTQVVPNPASRMVKISLSHEVADDLDIRLINIQGQSIIKKAKKTDRNTIEVNISDMPNGYYWIEFNNKEHKIVQRLVIQH